MHYLKYTYPTLPLINLIKRIPSVTSMRKIDHFRLCTKNLEKSIQEQSSWGLFLGGVGLQRRSPAGTENEVFVRVSPIISLFYPIEMDQDNGFHRLLSIG
ncbi:hypothetical protein TNIN_481741 [Trichonephila inaurata madagascariensis]|uniref:Uncharacterized protein n=1 Tax=Trichonephila inaurata madagascariensis TaxID=2747483 RepID=A0A8X6Y665_9ARAC|nr:hypothetical protein TNIN_481741 [Trichonephila inaurata madagascariensis]